MRALPEEHEIICDVPSPFCVSLKTDPPEVRQARLRKWMRNVLAYQAFWGNPERVKNGGPAWLRYFCSGCGKHPVHNVSTDGPIATCPKCGRKNDLRPEAQPQIELGADAKEE